MDALAPVLQSLLVAAVTGLVSGVATWGAMKVELRWLRRDVDLAHARIDKLPCQVGRHGRRAYDYCHQMEEPCHEQAQA